MKNLEKSRLKATVDGMGGEESLSRTEEMLNQFSEGMGAIAADSEA